MVSSLLEDKEKKKPFHFIEKASVSRCALFLFCNIAYCILIVRAFHPLQGRGHLVQISLWISWLSWPAKWVRHASKDRKGWAAELPRSVRSYAQF